MTAAFPDVPSRFVSRRVWNWAFGVHVFLLTSVFFFLPSQSLSAAGLQLGSPCGIAWPGPRAGVGLQQSGVPASTETSPRPSARHLW